MRVRLPRMTVGKKLFFCFIIVLLLTAVVGWMSLTNMKLIQNKSEEISKQWMPGVEAVNVISYLTENVHSLDMQLFILTDQAQLQTTVTQALAGINNVDERLKQFGESLTDEQEKRNFEAFSNQWNTYKGFHEKFVQLSKEVNLSKGSGNRDKEVQALLNDSNKVFVNLKKYLDVLVQIKHEGAAAASENSSVIYRTGQTNMLYVLGIAVLVGLALAFLITYNISKPVRLVSQALQAVSLGSLTERDVKVRNKDEIGELVGSLNRMKTNVRDILHQIRDASSLVADSSKELLAHSEQTSQASNQVVEVMQQVASGAEIQVQNYEDTHTAMTEMSMGVGRIAEASSEVSDISMEAFREAKQGEQDLQALITSMNGMSETVGRANSVIQNLESYSQQIDNMIGLMGGIAKQTNLLALNAAIEAARAGEAGKGFTVVAGEVRKLSEQSAQFANQITELIGQMLSNTGVAVQTMHECLQEVDSGKEMVHTAEASFHRIFLASEKVAVRIQEVAAAAQEMAATSEEVSASVAETSAHARNSSTYAQHVAETAEHQLTSLNDITQSAGKLNGIAEQLHTAVGKFKL
ncbi:methyl-accepting chemotaxis protein [Paenibacillus sedimenti]|uniref:Methyl-accepting chemotaxis protein n=1 Tax=Paenibacillus sedimenti TaxID=2770274 RepID=A0A926QJ34_9BACL|nr:methyl-accepting chemotaxis protein [Paenibacillus sedimenti]MBD0379977.1 methyl-accepting chemotaxis protein [Paenibacillus sedimenti]